MVSTLTRAVQVSFTKDGANVRREPQSARVPCLPSGSSSLRLCYQLLATTNSLFLAPPFAIVTNALDPSTVCYVFRLPRLVPNLSSRSLPIFYLFNHLFVMPPGASSLESPMLCCSFYIITQTCAPFFVIGASIPAISTPLFHRLLASPCPRCAYAVHIFVVPPFSASPISFDPRLAAVVCAAHLRANIIAWPLRW